MISLIRAWLYKHQLIKQIVVGINMGLIQYSDGMELIKELRKIKIL
jgi:hypothetical protein